MVTQRLHVVAHLVKLLPLCCFCIERHWLFERVFVVRCRTVLQHLLVLLLRHVLSHSLIFIIVPATIYIRLEPAHVRDLKDIFGKRSELGALFVKDVVGKLYVLERIAGVHNRGRIVRARLDQSGQPEHVL